MPDKLRDTNIMTLDLGALQAGASVKGEFEKRFKGLMAEVIQSPKQVILFIDEAHTLIGAGNQQGGLDISNLLKTGTGARRAENHRRHHLERVQKILRKRCRPVASLPVSESQRAECRRATIILRGLSQCMSSPTAC
ncbi:type VI secretion ATPase, ClpV1 family [Salmonella enterica subsp. houtenae]|nr:type VI secretion ATPase, ClpV1 family [Salmonella enterica subsp. houtenae]